MMAVILYLIFLIPLTFISVNWILMQLAILLICLYVLMINFYSYFSTISYSFGLDMISYGLIILSFLISSLMIISMVFYTNMSLFVVINLFMMFLLFMIFSTLSFIYMYMYFEFVLIPLLVLIMGMGYQPERLMAGMYLFFYTLFFSLPLFILIMYMYNLKGSLFFDYLINMNSSFFFIHLILTVVFLVKLPMYLVHFWLPKAHVQAPVSGSMILAGLMLKIGGYGLIRTMYMYEYMYMHYSFIWYSFSLIGSLLISIVCLMQGDMKCLIAYSSISHMGLVISGLMTMSLMGLWGSYFLMIGHGFCSSGLFYMANLFYARTSSRMFFINKGLMTFIPSCCFFWFLLCSFNMSCPPSLNFVSEFMILSSIINFWVWSIIMFVIISFFCACFSYYLYSFSQHGLYHNLYSFSSLSLLEFLCLFMHSMPLVLIPLFISVF
uniref:NADH-ubiquinone oxidoreductase chain 4 n=1 Tax=Cicadellidae sp. EMHAU-2015-Zz052706 TaxID=2037760 RepID=A0A2U7PDV0_9HEMI|nr:NADH dehydrogenase subunit 4 [Cicadellidae sp. EMHAU-2015-Zz052706]